MSSDLDEYLDRGLSGIFQVAYENTEDTGGFQDEFTKETLVAKTADGRFIRLESQEHLRFGPRAKRKRSESEAHISEEEYKRLAAGKSQLDTDSARQDYSARRAADARRQQARKELLKHSHRCAQHDSKLQLRTGRFGPYWACPKVGCNTKQNLSLQEKQTFDKTKP